MERKDQFMCESCGTVAAKQTKTSRLDRMLRHVSGDKRFTCGECGWTGLRNWSHLPAAIVLQSRARRRRLECLDREATAIESGLELLAASGR